MPTYLGECQLRVSFVTVASPPPSTRPHCVHTDFYADEPLVRDNTFIGTEPDRTHPPSIHDPAVRAALPRPVWDSAEGASAIRAWDKTWEIAFKNLRRVHTGNRFIAPYIDTAFNDCLFMVRTSVYVAAARPSTRRRPRAPRTARPTAAAPGWTDKTSLSATPARASSVREPLRSGTRASS